MKVKTLFHSLFILASLQAALLCADAMAQPPQGRGWPSQEPDPANLYTVTCGDVSMTVDAGLGARIRSFRLGEREILSQLRFPNSFGSTFWLSPQANWNWPPVPEHDRLPYVVSRNGEGNLVMTSSLSEKFPYRISKEFIPLGDKGALKVKYTVVNEGEGECSIAPWEISRVAAGGVIFFDAPPRTITPEGLMDFKSEYGACWYTFDEQPKNRKINADGHGWLAFANGEGLLLVKKFEDLSEGDPAPLEAEIQVYVNAGKTYIELEGQGRYTTLALGESLSWEVEWYLLPYGGEPVPSQELVSLVRGVIEK